ncbi:DoxX family protein [Algibacter sp. TI.3.09]|uniref:DoxX family protein n=1 Tax=Algibacter sp. TI.3.09 TaxID=3121298 RepID=UPI00311F1394
MANYHDTSISKTQKIAGYAMSILFSIQIIMAGVMKLLLAAPIVENMNAVNNWGDKTLFVGILELIILALYWIPKTQKLGFYLLCSFVGGVIVAEVVAGKPPIAGILISVLLYAGTTLRFPKLLK